MDFLGTFELHITNLFLKLLADVLHQVDVTCLPSHSPGPFISEASSLAAAMVSLVAKDYQADFEYTFQK